MTTKEKIEDYLGIDIDSSLDDAIDVWIGWVQKYIERFTKRTWASEQLTEYYKGTGTKYLNLKKYPVTTLTSLSENMGDVGDASWDAIDSDYYFLKENEGQIYLQSGFFKRENMYKVVYTAGEAIPADIEWVATAMVGDIIRQQNNAAKTPKSETLGELSVTFSETNLLPAYKEILDLYREPTM